MKDVTKVRDILRRNTTKQFVKRILYPQDYPVLNLGNEKGQVGTHLMSWSGVDGKYRVYPTILYDPETKQLTDYGMDRGFQEAMKRNEFIEFDDPNEADWFSRNYKLIWPEEMR